MRFIEAFVWVKYAGKLQYAIKTSNDIHQMMDQVFQILSLEEQLNRILALFKRVCGLRVASVLSLLSTSESNHMQLVAK
jgi:hypothetical protein